MLVSCCNFDHVVVNIVNHFPLPFHACLRNHFIRISPISTELSTCTRVSLFNKIWVKLYSYQLYFSNNSNYLCIFMVYIIFYILCIMLTNSMFCLSEPRFLMIVSAYPHPSIRFHSAFTSFLTLPVDVLIIPFHSLGNSS